MIDRSEIYERKRQASQINEVNRLCKSSIYRSKLEFQMCCRVHGDCVEEKDQNGVRMRSLIGGGGGGGGEEGVEGRR